MTSRRTILRILIQILIAVFTFIFVLKFLPVIHPLSQTSFEISQQDAHRVATEFIRNEIPLNKLKIKSRFKITEDYLKNPEVASRLMENLGFQPYKYWEIEMYSREMKTADLFLGSDQDESARRYTEEWYKLFVSPEGQVIKLDFEGARLKFFKDSLKNQPRSSVTDPATEENMRKKARIFLREIGKDTSNLSYQGSELKQDSIAVIYTTIFTEKINQSLYQHEVKLTSSGILLSYDFQIKSGIGLLGEKESETWSIVYVVMDGIIHLSLFILIIVFLIYFARKESISFKIGFPFVLIVFLLTVVNSLLELWHTSIELMLLSLAFTSISLSVGMLLLYAVCDPMARQQWSDKLTITDLFRSGNLFNRITAENMLRGIFLGIISLAGYSAIMFIYIQLFKGHFKPDEGLEYSFTVIFPVLALFTALLKKALFNEFFFRLFGVSYLRRKFRQTVTWILGSILLTFVFSADLEANHIAVRYLASFIPTALFVAFFIRYEIFTTIIGFMTFHLVEKAVVFSAVSEPYFNEIGTGNYVGLAGIIIFSVLILYFKRNEAEKIPKYIPEYIRNQQERERLLRELEIARSVQLKFLPNYTPQIPHFEISAFCQPAWEVGGDYYDFFKIDETRWGIAIGDVSNKGVSAAFYMTMVKGFLKSITIHHRKPADVLVESNTLFYENVERGHFISMIFGILDPESGVFTFSRAGHNPLLLLLEGTADGHWLTPEGMAIGMAPSAKFKSTIREESIQFKPGDTLVLYTDGYPEAMNSQSKEFGEENLEKLIKKYIHLSPREIISKLEEKIKEWEGNQTALDDRTVIVMKRAL